MITRTFDAPPSRVFAAWTKPELMKQWWAPPSSGISFVSCEIDARPGRNSGGSYRFVFSHPEAKQPMAFFGKYVEVIPNARLAWTNDEDGGNGAVTTVTFEERGAATLLTVTDTTGAPDMSDEQFAQLDALLAK